MLRRWRAADATTRVQGGPSRRTPRRAASGESLDSVGKSGWPLTVLNRDAENGLSLLTRGRLCVCVTPSSLRKSLSAPERIAGPEIVERVLHWYGEFLGWLKRYLG